MSAPPNYNPPNLPLTNTTPHHFLNPISIFSWNTTALYHQNPQSFLAKRSFLLEFLNKHQVLTLQDTHSLNTDEAEIREFAHHNNCTAFYTHRIGYKGGLLTLIKNTLIQTTKAYHSIADPEGRYHSITLHTQNGLLQIINAYLDPASTPTRQNQLIQISKLIQPQSTAYFMGDFNFITHPHDRINTPTNQPTTWSQTDTLETNTLHQQFPKFSELWQPDLTYRHSMRSSRLDRCYTNLTPAYQLSFKTNVQTILLPKRTIKDPFISDHHPLSIIITHPSRSPINKIPNWVIQHP